MVPSLPLHRQIRHRSDFITIGRILAHTTALLGFIPARISQTTLLCIAMGSEELSDEVLLQDFRLFLTDDDRSLFDKALGDFESMSDSEKDDLLTMLGTFGMYCLPNKNNIMEVLLNVARFRLVDSPAPFVVLIRRGIPEIHRELFWSMLTPANIRQLFIKQLPTGEKVKNIFVTESPYLSQEEQNCLHYLRQYVSGLDSDDLSQFLRFVTGSSIMPDSITVTFCKMFGIARRPVAHTCSNTLELSSTYESYQELRRELKCLLADINSYRMDIV